MKVILNRSFILLESNRLMRVISAFSATNIKAGAFFPFIVIGGGLKNETRAKAINHELIHFSQQKEMLFVGAWALRLVELLYYRLIRSKTKTEAYILHCSEQEAYFYSSDYDYLKTRKRYAHLRGFMRNKKVSREDLRI